MTPDIPVDLILFGLSIVVFLVIGLPLIMRRVSLPIRVEFEPVTDGELGPAQSTAFARVDAELLDLNYRPAGNWKPVNMQGQSLIRIYSSTVDPAIVMMNLMTSDFSLGAEQSMNYLEIATRYRDGTILSTRNAELSDVLEQLPEHILVERRGLRDPARLKKVHDGKAAGLLSRDPIHHRPEDFVQVFNDYHARWCAHQLDRGLLRPSPQDPERLGPTLKTALRGVFNFINPLADNFTVLRFLVVVLLGLIVPGAAMLWLTGPGWELVARISVATGLEPERVLGLCLGVAFTLSGSIVGFVFTGKSFIWGFLLSYLLLRLGAGFGFWTTFALCMWSGLVADLVTRWRWKQSKLT